MNARDKIEEAKIALKKSFSANQFSGRTRAIVELGLGYLDELAVKDWQQWQTWPQEEKRHHQVAGMHMVVSATLLLALAHHQDQFDFNLEEKSRNAMTENEPMLTFAENSTSPDYPVKLEELYELIPALRESHDLECKGELEDCQQCNKRTLWLLGKEIMKHQYPLNTDSLRDRFREPEMQAQIDDLERSLDGNKHHSRPQSSSSSRSGASQHFVPEHTQVPVSFFCGHATKKLIMLRTSSGSGLTTESNSSSVSTPKVGTTPHDGSSPPSASAPPSLPSLSAKRRLF